MKQDEVKKIRLELELTQDELATILGVTKAAITRYESNSEKTRSSPQGEVEKKLIQLQNLLQSPEEKAKLLKLRHESTGIASLAGLLAIGAATFSTVGRTTLGILPFGLGVLGIAGAALGAFINMINDENKNKN